VTDARGCEQLAQSCCLIAARPGIELTTSRSWIRIKSTDGSRWQPFHFHTVILVKLILKLKLNFKLKIASS